MPTLANTTSKSLGLVLVFHSVDFFFLTSKIKLARLHAYELHVKMATNKRNLLACVCIWLHQRKSFILSVQNCAGIENPWFQTITWDRNNKRFHILVFWFADKRYCSGRDRGKSENAIRERPKLQSELEKRKTLFISQGDDVWTPTFLAGTKEHVCYQLQRHDKTFASSHAEKQLLWDLRWNIEAGIRWRHTPNALSNGFFSKSSQNKSYEGC